MDCSDIITTGISTLIVPFWLPWLDVWTKEQLGINAAVAIDYTGWVLIALGIVLYFLGLVLSWAIL